MRTRRRPRLRRKLSALVAALATTTSVVVLGGATPAAAVGPALLPLSITNSTGRADAVHLYVLGTNLSTGRLGYVNAAGTFTAWPAGGNPPTPAPDVSIPGPAGGASKTIQVPRGISGRVYFSMGQKLNFYLTPDGLVQPAPWAAGDSNRDILFDWSEFTYNDAGLWLNSSQVDMFAIPHTVSVTPGSGAVKSTGTVVSGGRNGVINGIKAQSGWGGSVYTRSDGTVLRVLAPGKAADAGLLSSTYLDPYITSAWNAYTTKTLTVVPFGDQPNLKYFGRTSGTTMTFTNAAGQRVASFAKPSSANVWGCDGALAAPNDQVVGPISRTLCAALNRGTLGTVDTQPSTDASAFYRSNPTNQYARLVHANMLDGKAYAFAFDDVGAFESLVHDGSPRAAGITLDSFTGGGTTPPPSSGTRLISDWNGKCITVPNQSYADGTRLQTWGCDGSAAQSWTFTGGTIKTQNNMCVDVAWGSTANGAAIQIATCSGNPAQQFVLSGAGDLVNPQANKCVDISDWNGNNGAVLALWECAGTANQKWHTG
ncbi:glycoside hydrolase family 64 protein [Actinokineospora bangkokensis]|uniref:Glucan endo-1,3-beta-D-glucosidase n=1 Tax=Actinokineospora bangkokensis TaxID=1193682 RepID=A0A1Q9LIG4_9PSEU|nr:beta-1,3-glucanase family protein [Actinokineospora bangkokensis]OLR91818.1 glucan endo-1,3-beta-D-glucosidase [Actinokineospora bangkokensis]